MLLSFVQAIVCIVPIIIVMIREIAYHICILLNKTRSILAELCEAKYQFTLTLMTESVTTNKNASSVFIRSCKYLR